MKHYMLSLIQPAGDEIPPPEVLEPVMRDLDALTRQMQEAGVWVFAGGLHPPSTATTLRPQDGDVLVTDGPFTEGKEVIGGFTIIRAPDLDAALTWGRRVTQASTLPVEVRPLEGIGGCTDQAGRATEG